MSVKMGNGKSYLTVIERMNMLLEEKGKEDYSLETSVQYDSGIIIVKATLTLFYCYPKDKTDSVEVVSRKYCGHALGELGKHKTLEATETHAIGRALASAGWFGDEFASANEMESWEQPNKEGTAFDKAKSKPVNLKDLEVKLPEKPKADKSNIDDIVKASNGVKVVDDMKVTFGKNKGKMMSECDKDYLDWLSKTATLDFIKDDNGQKDLDRIKKFKDCAAYYLAVDVEIPF